MNHSSIHEAAAAWVVAHDRGLTAAEQDAFSEWLAADPRHGRAFQEQMRVWNSFNLLEEWRPRHSHEPNPDILDGSLLNRLKRRRATLVRLAATAACIGAAIWAGILLVDRGSAGSTVVAPGTPSESYRVTAAESRFVTLPDQSEIDLNDGAELQVNYTPQRRAIEVLRGEAFFTVKKDATRPFDVAARGTKVRAVGTRFGVRLEQDRVAVVVEEGQVIFGPADAIDATSPDRVSNRAVNLHPGDFTSWSLDASSGVPPVRELTADETRVLLQWKPEVLDFASQPLGEVVEQFNQRNQLKIILRDPALRTIPIVASFRANNVQGFVKLLEVTGVARTGQVSDSTIELVAP